MEAGYTKFPNELLDWLLAKSSVLSKREIVVFLAIVRNTIGWRKDSSVMSCRFIAKATGLDPANVSKAIKLLEELGAIIVDRSTGTTTVKLDWEQTVRCCQIDNGGVVKSTTGVLSNQPRNRGQIDHKQIKERQIKEKNTEEVLDGLF